MHSLNVPMVCRNVLMYAASVQLYTVRRPCLCMLQARSYRQLGARAYVCCRRAAIHSKALVLVYAASARPYTVRRSCLLQACSAALQGVCSCSGCAVRCPYLVWAYCALKLDVGLLRLAAGVDLSLSDEQIQAAFPRFPGKAAATEVTLQAGQMLYLPAGKGAGLLRGGKGIYQIKIRQHWLLQATYPRPGLASLLLGGGGGGGGHVMRGQGRCVER